jgi:hypothetical protein
VHPGRPRGALSPCGSPALDDGLPPIAEGPPDLAPLIQAAAALGAEILGPPPAELVALG